MGVLLLERPFAMKKALAILIPLMVAGISGQAAQAGSWHAGPPCPDTHYWHLSTKAYAQWREFGLFRGSWGEKHRVVHRHRGHMVVKVWRPAAKVRCEPV
jgi:hypothetical protein